MAVGGAAQRVTEPVGVVRAFGVARDLGADDAGGVAVFACAPDAPYRARIQALDLERAGARAIVRTGREGDVDRGAGVHVVSSVSDLQGFGSGYRSASVARRMRAQASSSASSEVA